MIKCSTMSVSPWIRRMPTLSTRLANVSLRPWVGVATLPVYCLPWKTKSSSVATQLPRQPVNCVSGTLVEKNAIIHNSSQANYNDEKATPNQISIHGMRPCVRTLNNMAHTCANMFIDTFTKCGKHWLRLRVQIIFTAFE